MSETAAPARNFVQQIIDEDIREGKWGGRVQTRFPPEPNGYLHVGHARNISLNYDLAAEYQGGCNLRFDDTNPAKEEDEFVRAIIGDIRWLGYEGPVVFASDYFQRMYDHALVLIRKGLAYVDDQTPDQIRQARGTLTEPGRDSPHRGRSPEENESLFAGMRAGEFPDGSRVLRAKIDMASPNMNLRDPVMYRVLRATHHRTGDEWCIYPMYDWAHGLEDAYEAVTHSICTLEFEAHRPLYDWFLDQLDDIPHPRQIEVSRLNPTYTIMSKRTLRRLVEDGVVEGWDDPRMPTLAGMRRRGFTPEAVRAFCRAVGVTKFNASHDIGLLENAAREHLNRAAPRRMAVLRPLKVTITNWGEHGDEARLEEMRAVNNPENEAAGSRTVRFGPEIYIERDDFMLDPPKKFFRLRPGGEVRLRYAYWITCHDHVTDADGNVVELLCTYDPETRGGDAPPPDADGKVRKVKGTLHWVGADCIEADVRLFDRMFSAERPGKKTGDHLDDLNPDSLRVLRACKLEPGLGERLPDEPEWGDGIRRFQFERLGYFCIDAGGAADPVVFNRTVTLKDGWARAKG